MFTKNLWRSKHFRDCREVLFNAKKTTKTYLQRARLGDRIRKLFQNLESERYTSNRCVEMRAQVDRVGSSTRDINNSNDVRKFFNKIDGSNVINGYYQLLVKSMHKKVLKGT